MKEILPVNEPWLGDREIEYVTECVRSGWISSAGRFLEEFEGKWAAYCGMRHGISVCNGTAALEVAVRCAGLGEGDEVIMPSFTIISCALAVVETGAVPVLVDCDPRTWCLDVSRVEERVTERTRAILPVHIYGHPADMDPLLDLAAKRGLTVIEDAAEAHGAEYLSGRNGKSPSWKRCGGLGHVSTFSFYANKLITTGEGGMVLTNDPSLAEKARSFRNLCFRPERRFYHTELGRNFRFTNVQAAIGLAQMERMDEILARKRRMGRMYADRLKDIPVLQLPVEESWARNVYWMYGMLLDEAAGIDAGELARRLKADGIETRPFFLGMHEQPVFLERGLFRGERHPVTERIARRGLYLPSGLTITERQIDRVCGAVRGALA